MRIFWIVMFSLFGAVALLILPIVIAWQIGWAESSFAIGFMSWIALTVAMWYGYKWALNKILLIGRIDTSAWLATVKNCDSRDSWDGTGIAIDTDNRKLYLLGHVNGRSISKAYPFEDVKEWGYDIPGRDYIVGGGSRQAMHNGAYNATGMLLQSENTHFWVKVKDVNYPSWKVRFDVTLKADEVERKLERWMERLSQNINQDLPVS
jgi:hypothetical protein